MTVSPPPWFGLLSLLKVTPELHMPAVKGFSSRGISCRVIAGCDFRIQAGGRSFVFAKSECGDPTLVG
jgi:hypothetical protein